MHARIARLVSGAPEPKAGAVVSTTSGSAHAALNHHVEVTGGVLEAECREVVREFFRARR